MVIDVSELGTEAVIAAVLAVLVSVPLVGLGIAVVASRLGRRPFGFGSIGMGTIICAAAAVVVVVLQRTISGEVSRTARSSADPGRASERRRVPQTARR